MYLPTDIWEKIMLSMNSGACCERLYNAFPKKIRNELMDSYMDHRKLINIRILCAVKNTTALFIENGIYVKFYQDDFVENDVIFVRHVPNMIWSDDFYDCIVSATRKGTVMFWDAYSNRYIDRIDIGSKIEHMEFHPNKSRMVISTITDAGLEIQSLIFSGGGIIVNETVVGYDKDYEIKLVYHPTLPHLYIIRSSQNILSVYLWKYEEHYDETDPFTFSEFERIDLPTIINFSINSVENYMYAYHTPFRIMENGDFECLCKGIHHYSIVRMDIRNARFFVKEVEILLYPCREVNDYLRVGTKIYYIENQTNIIEQHGMTTTVLYVSQDETISKFELRRGNLIFLEGDLFKRIDLDTRIIDNLFNWRTQILEEGEITLGAYCVI
jgi:hypothetical protein